MQLSAPHIYHGSLAEVRFEEDKTYGLSISIDTPRTHIRSIQKEDLPSLIKLYQDENAMSMVCAGGRWTEAKIQSTFERIMKERSEHNPYTEFAVCTKTGEFLGIVSLDNYDGHPTPGEVEFGGIGFPAFWNQRYGSEVASAVVRDYARAARQEGYLIEGKPLHKIFSTTNPDNRHSGRILEQLGFHFEKKEERFGVQKLFYALQV